MTRKNAGIFLQKDMAGMRDVLIHEYFGVRMERVWDTAKNDVPKLKKKIGKLLE